ncbi:MAG: GTP 3',8-cyclase MoaA [Sandaracinaceae bacterium]|nr:GTP 3',8-cyclase MoaA [Sandaracinaceae bacterium]
MPADFGAAGMPRLRDTQGRSYSYLRLSLTDRCDLACVYCMPPGGEDDHAMRAELLSTDEVVRLVRLFAQSGIRRVRFTGGEPLVRKDVVEIVARVSELANVDELVMTTNATRLATLAKPLRDAGLHGVNISIDSFDASTFARMTRGGELAQVLRGLDAALDVGLEVKLNAVVLRGENDQQLVEIVERAWALGATPRFIELMPIGEGSALVGKHHVPMAEMVHTLGGLVEGARVGVAGAGPARYMTKIGDARRRVGFITAMTESFCDSCNRVRVTVNGNLRSCFATTRGVSLCDAMRRGDEDRQVSWAIHDALAAKDDTHHFLDPQRLDHRDVGMSLIGG